MGAAQHEFPFSIDETVVLSATKSLEELVAELPEEMTTRQGHYSNLAAVKVAYGNGAISGSEYLQYERFATLDTIVRAANLLDIVNKR